MKINPKTNDWTRPKYVGFKPLHNVEKPVGMRVVLGEYLESIGLSQRALAELCDLSQPAINDLCMNRTQLFNMSNIVRICSVLGCSIDDIMRIVPVEETAYKFYE
jgi:DNA-binding Xre family transcriptional regulator